MHRMGIKAKNKRIKDVGNVSRLCEMTMMIIPETWLHDDK